MVRCYGGMGRALQQCRFAVIYLLLNVLIDYLSYAYMTSPEEQENHYLNFKGSTFLPLPLFDPLPPRPL